MYKEFTGWRDFIGKRNTWFLISLIVIAGIGLGSLFVPPRGFNVGIDFTGGYIIQYPTARQDLKSSDVGAILDQAGIKHQPVQITRDRMTQKVTGFLVRTEGYDKDEQKTFEQRMRRLKVRFRLEMTSVKAPVVEFKYVGHDVTREKVEQFLQQQFKGKYSVKSFDVQSNPVREGEVASYNISATIQGAESQANYTEAATALYLHPEFGGYEPSAESRTEEVSPVFSTVLFYNALKALIIAVIGILIYVWVRFELWFAVAAIVALIHDCLFTLGAYSILQLEINASFVAVILTVFGYSINDTIVIFDRIRENMRKDRKVPLAHVMNASLWETMPRSINTVLTTQVTLLAVIVFGGVTIREFALGMFLGIMAGAYSSIFIAAPLAYWFKKNKADQEEMTPQRAAARAKEKKKAALPADSDKPAPRKKPGPGTPGTDADGAGETAPKKTPGVSGGPAKTKKQRRR